MAVQPKSILKRWSSLLMLRAPWERNWRSIAKFFIPHKSNVNISRSAAIIATDVYDSVGVHANELLASSMAGSLTSPAVPWFSLQMQSAKLNGKKAVRKWLDDCAQVIYLTLRQSNFHSEAHEIYKDLGSLGTGALFCEERSKKPGHFDGLMFRALSLGEYAISEDDEGRVNVLFRKFKLSYEATAKKFGADSLSPSAQKQLKENPDELIEILHAVYPREGGNEKAKNAKKLPFASVYMELCESHVLQEGGYHEFPYFVPRWDKTSGEVWGRSPGFTALPDVKTLNKIQELNLKALAKAIDPPMKQRNNGVVGKVKMQPGSLTTVHEMDDLQPIEFNAKFNITAQEKEDLRQNIKHVFFWDQLQLGQGVQMTATEVERRFELMQRLLGPTLGRLENEFLNLLISRVFAILLRYGKVPEIPPIVMQAMQEDQDDIDVRYEGPLAKAQRGSEIASVEKTMATIAPLVPIFPDIVDNFDEDQLAQHVAEINGMPSDVMRDADAVAQIRQSKAQGAQQAAQMQQMQQGSEVAKNLAQANSQLTQAQDQGQQQDLPLPDESEAVPA